jgi:hypothetical protein
MQVLFARLIQLGGGLLALLGAVYTIGLLPTLDTSERRFMVDLLGLLAFGLVPLGLGLGGIWYGRRWLRQRRQAETAHQDAELEQRLLQLARTRPAGITAREGATHTALPLQEVEEKLRQLHLDGALDMEVTEQGRLVYKLIPSSGC